MIGREKATEILADRQRAYLLLFNDKDKAAAAQAVFADLMVFCRANETCLIPGYRDQTNALEGRREVYLRIRDHLDLTTEQLVEKYTRPAKGAHGHDDTDPSE